MTEFIKMMLSLLIKQKTLSLTTRLPAKCPLLRMGRTYPSVKTPLYFLELYKMDFGPKKMAFDVDVAYQSLVQHDHLKNAQINFLNLNANNTPEFISFDKRKRLFGGDLLLPHDFSRSNQWQDLKNFAIEAKLCIGYHLLIRDTTCLEIKRENNRIYLVNPLHIQPKAYLFKP